MLPESGRSARGREQTERKVELNLTFNDEEYRLGVERAEDGYEVTVGDRIYRVSVRPISSNTFSLVIHGANRLIHIASAGRATYVAVDGRQFCFQEATPGGRKHGTRDLPIDRRELTAIAPMPGRVVKLNVTEGDRVERGHTLAVVEAMKMENEVRAPIDGFVDRVLVREDDMVNVGQVMIELRSGED
jgi:biotin carboxyl carrier protein